LTNCFGGNTPNSEITPERFLSFVLSKAGLNTSIFLILSSQTSLLERFSIFIFFVNFRETPHEYLGMLYDFASLQSVLVPILFPSIRFVKASASNKNRSHFFRDCSAARSGAIITFIPDEAKSFAVVRPCNNGSTSVV